MWVTLSLISAILLGFYNVTKKQSVNNNAIWPVLLISSITGACIVTPFVAGSFLDPVLFKSIHLYVPQMSLHEHFLIIIKTLLVVSSWVLSFNGLKHIPITIEAPVRSTNPIWTLIGAIIIFNEHLSALQWIGIIITIAFFIMLSFAGKKEGIVFSKNIWIFLLILSTVFSAASGLFDKFLLKSMDRLAVQAWFTIYQVIILLPAVFFCRWIKKKKNRPVFHWRWSIPAIGSLLILADFLYFYAVSCPGAMISMISVLRKGNVLIAFIMGILFFKEKNIRPKIIPSIGILIGILIISLGS